MTCPICRQRKPKRFCPPQGEKICAICCGTSREVTIDCPSDCPYLVAAHRYEQEHRLPLERGELPYPEVRLGAELIEGREDAVLRICQAIVEAVQETHATDGDALAALAAMAETYRTLRSGIYYEQPPNGAAARELYNRLATAIGEYNREPGRPHGFPALKESEIFEILVFLLRVGKQETNGRARSRAFLDFIRAWLPPTKPASETSRIILP